MTAKTQVVVEESKLVIGDNDQCVEDLEDASNALEEASTSLEEGNPGECLDTIESVMANLAVIRTYLEEQVGAK